MTLRRVLFFLLAAPVLFAGIRGRVMDAATGLPIAGAQISAAGVAAVRTDSSGDFLLPTMSPGWRIITVTHPAFADLESEFLCDENTPLRITLRSSPYVLPDVIVRSTRGTRSVRSSSIPSAVTEGNTAAAEPSGGVTERLRDVPGLSLVSDGGWASTVAIRGMSRTNTVLSVDDVRLEAASDIAAVLSLIDPYDLERVEVVKGSGSVMNGTAASGGAVNCLIRRPSFTDDAALHYEAVIGGGSVNRSRTLHASAEGADEEKRFRISLLSRDAGDYRTAAGSVRSSGFHDGGVSLSGGLRLGGGQTIDLLAQQMEGKDIGIPGGSAIAAAATAKFSYTRRSLVRGEYSVTGLLPTLPLITIRLARQSILRNVRIEQPGVLLTPHAEHITWSGTAEAQYRPSDDHAVTAGIDLWERGLVSRREKYAANGTTTTEAPLPDAHFASLGAFVQDAWEIMPLRSTVTIGGRADRILVRNDATKTPLSVVRTADGTPVPFTASSLWNTGTDRGTSGSVMAGIRHTIAEEWEGAFHYSTAFRAATLEERFQYIQLGSTLRVGDPSLRPEQSAMMNASLRWTGRAAAVMADVYRTSFRDLITEVPGFFHGGPALVKTNIGTAEVYGYEISASAAVTQQLLLHLRGAYTRGVDKSAGKDLPFMPPLTGSVTGEWRRPERCTLALEVTAVADQHRCAPGESATGGYLLAAVRIQSEPFVLFGATMTAGAGVQNLTDRLYRSHLSTLRGLERNEPGRNVYGTLIVQR